MDMFWLILGVAAIMVVAVLAVVRKRRIKQIASSAIEPQGLVMPVADSPV